MHSGGGFLGSFLSKGLKTNQLELNTDEKTLRPIARLKEPRDLFALPKDKDHDCPQQAPRWPIECQVIEERIAHISYVPTQPEAYNHSTGCELKPRPVGEENGVVVYNYNPISAVNYDKDKKKSQLLPPFESSDSDISSSESRGSSPDRISPDRSRRKHKFSKLIERSSSNSLDDYDEDDEDDYDDEREDGGANITPTPELANLDDDQKLQQQIDDIWADKTPEYSPATPNFIKSQFSKNPLKFAGITAKVISPVRFDPEQLARLSLGSKSGLRLSSSSSNSGSSDESNLVVANKDGHHKKNDKDSNSKSISNSNRTTTNDDDMKLTQELMKKYQSYQEEGTNSPRPLTIQQQVHGVENAFVNENMENTANAIIIENSKNLNKIITDELSQPQFSRSAVGGSKFLTNCHPYSPEEYDGLEFESRFESGNLARAIKITHTYYELYLRPDLYTSRSKQWFYFRVQRTKKNIIYRFSIVNLVKSDSLYNDGMRPLMYSTINAKQLGVGWSRCGENICYYRNDDESSTEDDEDNASYTLTFNVEFSHDDDTVFFAHSYPYTYSELQDYLMEIQKNPVKSKFCKLRLLCRSLAGNNVYYLTVTAPTNDEEAMKRKKSIVVSARVHPSETPSSWMMKGLMDFITGESSVAKRLRHKFIFKLIPMLNPDGVIVGNTRNSLTGKDLNRQYRTVIRETYPSIWYTKAMIKRLIDECGVSMYCDMHAHSRKHNIFIYGCENKRNPEKKLTEQVFPLMMHKNVADKFSFESCKFKIQRSKEGTGRIVVWMLGITNSYTIEASFGGSSLGSRKGTHFTTADYEQMGRAFCETLLDYCDENPNKERLRLKIIERLLKEGSSADEPLNIPLSDYSSDEGDTSSSSDNEGKASISLSDLEGPCCAPLKAPPSSPEARAEIRRFKFRRMRKVMHELDRIYFQPLFQRKLRTIMKRKLKKAAAAKKYKKPTLRDSNQMPADNSKRLEGGTSIYQTAAPDEATACGGNSLLKRHQELIQTLRMQKIDTSYNGFISYDLQVAKAKRDEQQKLQDEKLSLPVQPQKTTAGRVQKKKKKKSIKKLTPSTELMRTIHPNLRDRVKVSRKLRLWLNTRRIVIFRQRKNRKSKMRSKSSQGQRKKADPQRTPLDMPTTDPGSDLHFSTDDESAANISSPTTGEVYATLPRPRRILLQSELQRRYIEEIGDGASMMLKHMPPELIVTSPSKQNAASKALTFKSIPRTAPDKGLLTEFPIIGGPARRTNSWHNLHNSGKCLPKLRVQIPQEVYQKDDLQVKLSLKKKIWTGVQPEQAANFVERNRPLSWGVPPLGTQTKKETNTLTTRSNKKDENEELLTACSQKLLAWQHDTNNTPTAPKTKLNVNLQVPDMASETSGLRVFKQLTNERTQQKGFTKLLEGNEGKNKRKKNPLSKVAETNQLVTCLTRRKTRSMLSSTQRQTAKGGGGPAPTGSMYVGSGYKMQTAQGNRFKTGGLVATAVQPNTKKNKKLQSLINNSGKTVPAINATAKSPNTTNMERNNTDEPGSTFVRKVKTKLRKKKSNGNLAAAAMTLSQCAGMSVTAVTMSKKAT